MSAPPARDCRGRARRASARLAALAGAAGAGVALAFLWALSRIAPTVAFPPYSLAERLVRLAPGQLATTTIERLGHLGLPLLAAGVTGGYVALGAALTAIASRASERGARWAGAGLLTALWGASLSYRMAGVALAPLLAACAGAALLFLVSVEWLLELPGRAAREADLERRQALAWLLAATAGLVVGGELLGRLTRAGSPAAVALRAADEPARIPDRGAFPTVAGLSPEVTSPQAHYVVDIDIDDPLVDASDWRLRVDGSVEHPLALSFDELQRRFALIEQYSALTCVSNEVGGPLIGNSKWTGVRLRDVLAAAQPAAAASELVFECADGYTVAVPLATATQPYALLALAQGGRPLRREHGFPCRVRIPALYGMMNAKWLERIRVVDRTVRGFWAQRGWSPTGVVRTESRIDSRADVHAGEPTWLAGVAWAGVRGISRVEVSTDGGRTWNRARLHPPLSPYAWTQWAYRWLPARAALYDVQCRAADGAGTLQDPTRRAPHPAGATGYHRLSIRAI